MQDREVPYDVPVADAVEQQRPADSVPDDEDAPLGQDRSVPLESSASDWQEQQQTVDLDPDLERFDYGGEAD
ncbi:hypothetical protein [Mycolicibacterium holsaticum]|uniref:Uncharacterized protein n=1 Tax=Mycolicibacterium holsaticum TaxID=152142 RepID=A0A1E3S2H8_9MYCO|nr:hypothetical protein [Mycolicibacterium holsaticum]ODQ95892.1 hypothetical protein BHQ17_03065 [Mycolicibacterium holsaticum]